jgi:RHS repeat-associated protein
LGGFTVTNGDNTFTAIADDSLGRYATNSITCYLPATNSFTYDLNGNLLSDGYRTFTYDDENELTSIVVSNGVATPTLTSNIYDGKMRLRIRREYTWSSGWQWTTEAHYIYDGNVVIQERDVNNLPMVTYTRGNDLSRSLQGAGGIGGLLARTQNQLLIDEANTAQATSYYHADGNGNVTMLINSVQGIAAKYEYDPYGNVLSLSGSLAAANMYRFSSKEYFQNSGLIYYLYRFYDPNLQRWPNRDPIDESGFKANRVLKAPLGPLLTISAVLESDNTYQFGGNDPEDNVDPKGLFAPGAGCPMPPNPPRNAVSTCNSLQNSDCAAICAADGETMVSCTVLQPIVPVPGKHYWKKVGAPWVLCICTGP